MARQIYNDTWASGGDKVDPGGVKVTQGWIVEAPPHEYFNFWQGQTDEMLQHLERNGIAEYNASTIYEIGGYCREGTVTYRSLVVSNQGNLPSTSPTEWVQAFLIPGNNLSDLADVATARTNLDVYSKGEADANFLDEASNLSDLSNVATARTNLDVYSTTEVDTLIDGKDEASEISYNNIASGLTATDTQAALDEIDSNNDSTQTQLDNHEASASAHASSDITYDNTVSGLTAINVKTAIDEVDGDLDSHLASSSAHSSINIPYDNSTVTLNAINQQEATEELALRPRKNYIINGDFDIWQRGTSFTIGSGILEYTADRWFVSTGSSGTGSVSRASNTPDSEYLLQATLDATGGTFALLGQRIEDHISINGEEVMLSADLWASVAGDIKVDLEYYDGASFAYATAQTLSLTTTKTRYKLTFNVPSFTAKTASSFVAVRFLKDDGASITINVAQVQLEEGPAATDFEYRPIGEELALCQRYFEIVNASTWAAASGASRTINTISPYAVIKRIVPSVTRTGDLITGSEAGTRIGVLGDKYGLELYKISGDANDTIIGGVFEIDAEL